MNWTKTEWIPPIRAALNGFDRWELVCVILKKNEADPIDWQKWGYLNKSTEWCRHCVYMGYRGKCREYYSELGPGDYLLIGFWGRIEDHFQIPEYMEIDC